MFSNLKKFTVGILVALVLSANGAIFFPEPAHAGLPVIVAESVPDIRKGFIDTLLEALGAASKTAVMKFADYAMRKVAYDSAVWLSTGGKGKSPLAHTQNFGDYIKSVGDEAAGAALQELGRVGGLNLCKVPDIRVDMAIKVGLRTKFLMPTGLYGPNGKPECTLSQWKEEWGNAATWESKYGGTKQISERFNMTFRTDDSPLGIYGAASEKIGNIVRTQQDSYALQRQEGGGAKPKETAVSGQIQTPAPLILDQLKEIAPHKQQDKTKEQFDVMVASGDVKIIPAALTLFINTLVGEAVKNFQNNGILPFGIGCDAGTCPSSGTVADTVAGSVADQYYGLAGATPAQDFFDYLRKAPIDVQENYDIISQLNTCTNSNSGGVDANGVYNCRMDDGLTRALKQAQAGQPITIAQALKEGTLNPEWLLISADDNSGRNNDSVFCRTAYCQSNIQVLRQLRILPLGFEIAARNSDRNKPWKLGDVVAGFNKCSTAGTADLNSPFCKLIDPNWVIKSPPAKCNAFAYGPSLLAEGVPTRMQECVDVQTCVVSDSSGNCLDYGYCTREKNIWNFGLADKCSNAEYATCRAFKESTTGKNVAYLYRTLDSASCTQQNVGCNAYSLSLNSSGAWVAPGTSANGKNLGIYFNNKVESSCSANSAGCSSFNFVGVSGNPHFIKKAPDYLGCYDADTTSAAIDWPKSPSDLAKVSNSAACKQYAGVCIPEEVSCNFYTPVKGKDADKIPGRFTPRELVAGQIQWNDECSATCNGYAAYSEMPSNYANGRDVAYIVPSSNSDSNSGRTCKAEENGCTAFTNLSTTQGGLEKTEYFTKLRACVTPKENKGKQFVTYEGSIQGGYQLKTFTLVENKDDLVNGPNGAPKYFVKTNKELEKLNQQCNKTTYDQGIGGVDCRQFNDDAGTIYYRLLSYTIPVSEQCTPYRLSNNEFISENLDAQTCISRGGLIKGENSCQLCFQNGKYDAGSCFYDGLPGGVDNTAGASVTCSASVNTCREYKGNDGNNIDQIFNDTFEKEMLPADLAAWSNGTVAAESTRAGENSMLYNGQAGLVRNVRMPIGESYDLSFWAKGTGGSVTIKIGEQSLVATQEVGTVSVNDTWKLYHVGPFVFNGSTSTAKIVFTNNPSGRLFIDNAKLVRVKSMLYLVKDSLKVDAVCDSNLNDNLPGDQLGCKAYTNPQKETKYLTGFTSLCREDAVGCTAMIDTKNTASSDAQAYNVWLAGAANTTVRATVGIDDYSCTITTGNKGCYINIIGHNRNEILKQTGLADTKVQDHFVASTIYTEEDTLSNAPEYLVANEEATCRAADLGCTLAGVQRITPTGVQFITTTIKNDPSKYDATLCVNEAVGCNSYSDGNDTRFFKDPAITGQKVCSYRTGVTVETLTGSTIQASGWFWKGVGVCSNNKAEFCSQNSDCGGTNTCIGVGDQACYPSYLNGGTYGLWSAANDKYKNFVGECPVDQNTCTEFIDRNDNDRAYHLLKNSKLTAGDCNGQVSQRAGCAVFDQTDNPNKFFNAERLYAQSDAQQGALVAAPQTAVADNDSNIILSVTRDRACGEWLSCPDGRSVFDENTGKFKYVCYSVSRCNGDGCGAQVARSDYTNNVLTESTYRSRELGWKKMEYSGYSLLNVFPVEELSEWNYNTSTDPNQADWHLVKKIPCNEFNCSGDRTDYGCEVNGQICGSGQSGICKNNVCVVAIDGSKKVEDDSKVAPKQSCRAYPESDSPFPNTPNLAPELFSHHTAIQTYSQAHFCNESEAATNESGAYLCDCSYDKIQYGDSVTKYWNYFAPASIGGGVSPANSYSMYGGTMSGAGKQKGIPAGICINSTASGYGSSVNYNGKACSANWECGNSGGICQLVTKETRFLGFKGFCLEQDLSRVMNGDPNQHPCLTWWPNNTLQGVPDSYNQYKDAGFNPNSLNYSDGPYYCGSSGKYQFIDREIKSVKGQIDCDGNLQTTWDETVGGIRTSEKYIGKSFKDFLDILTSLGPNETGQRNDGGVNGLGCFSDIENSGQEHFGPGTVPYFNNAPYYSFDAQSNPTFNAGAFCSAGYTLGKLVRLESVKVFTENEDQATLWYECVPEGTYWRESKPVSVAEGSVVYKEDEWCKTLYKVSNAGENKGWTERLWKENNPSALANYLYSFTEGCNPFAATSLNTLPPKPGPVVIKNDINCIPGRYVNPPEPQYNNSSPYNAKKVYPGPDRLKDIFAKGFETLTLVQDYTGLKCEGMPLINGKTCTDSVNHSDCRALITTDVCEGIEAKTCQNDPQGLDSDADKFGQSCTKDADCINNNTELLYTYNQPPHNEDDTQIVTQAKHLCRPQKKCKATGVVCDQNSDCHKSDPAALCIQHAVPNTWHYATTTNNKVTWDVSNVATAKPPTVLSIGECRQIDGKEICTEGVPGFSIFTNSKFYTNESVQILVPGQKVDVRFFAYADNNQMPIRKRIIDWGDGVQSPESDHNYYRNRRGAKDGTCIIPTGQTEGTCLVTNLFGSQGSASYGKCRTNNDCRSTPICASSETAAYYGLQKDVTCDNTYAGFNGHTYACVKNQGTWKETCDVNQERFPDGCCVYKPKIYVKDNWGWSIGSCRPNGGGCFDGQGVPGNGTDETRPSLLSPWLYYGDSSSSSVSVYVAPKQN